MTKIKTERNFGAVIPFSELNIGDVFVSKDNNENLYIKICESTDELNMSNNTIGIGQAYTTQQKYLSFSSLKAETVEFKSLKEGDIFVVANHYDGNRVYIKFADSTFSVNKGMPFEQNAFCINTGRPVYLDERLKVYVFNDVRILCE